MCSKKLKAALPEWLPHYGQENGVLTDELRGQLHNLSAATIDRWLVPYHAENSVRRGLAGTKPVTLLKNQIPIKTDHWDIHTGFLEADTVWNKGCEAVKEQTQQMEHALPFPILGFDCDNRSEFLN